MSGSVCGIRRRTWAEIDLDAIEYNFSIIKQSIGASRICCVVKANAYGHGVRQIAAEYERLGADFLAVSNIEEALQIRDAGVSLPILILGYTPEECAALLSENNISQCVYSKEYGLGLAEAARRSHVRVKIHIKIDSGMGRIGFISKGSHCEFEDALEVCRCPEFITEGIFTHFAAADESDAGENYTHAQLSAFLRAVDHLTEAGVHFELRHAANSAAAFDYPEARLDMVRAGDILYGLAPSGLLRNLPSLRPAMTLQSVISHIKELLPGEAVSYGCRFVALSPMRVATVPIGYADGLSRACSDGAYSLMARGKLLPILGRVCMDQLMVDVSNTDCKVGDAVTVFGGHSPCTADGLAAATGTINYEVVCAVGERVPRAFIRSGEIIAWQDNLIVAGC